jgi:hypothetical protein
MVLVVGFGLKKTSKFFHFVYGSISGDKKCARA